jgi:hypothetical protein
MQQQLTQQRVRTMMTLQEPQATNINPEVAKEAYAHASRRLEDVLAMKASYEQKAFSLLAGYVAVTLALFTAGGVAHSSAQATLKVLEAPVWITGLLYVIGSAVLVVALWDREWGVLASAPEMWLVPGVIDGGETAMPARYLHRPNDLSITGRTIQVCDFGWFLLAQRRGPVRTGL